MRKVAKFLIFGVALVCAAVAVALATHTGQSAVLRLASALSSNNEGGVAIGALEGSLFGDGALDEISLHDKDGPWLTARRISFSWSPSQLLSGRLDVAYLRAEQIDVLRLPAAGQATKEKTSGGSGFELPIKIALDELDLKTIALSDKVIGEAAVLRVTGIADVVDAAHSSTARLHLARLDGPRGDLRAYIAFIPTQGSLQIEIEGNEPAGGIVSRLLDLPSRPAMGININGQGTLDAWRADLKLSASGAPFVAGIVNLDAAEHDKHRLTGKLAGYFDTLVPRSAAELFAGKMQLDVAANVYGLANGSPTSVRGISIGISGDQMRITATGAAEFSDAFIFGELNGRIGRDDGQPLRFAVADEPPVSVRDLTFSVKLPEQRTSRRVSATAQIKGLNHQQLSAGTLTLTAHALQPQPSGKGTQLLDDVKVAVTATGIDEATALGKAIGREAHANGTGSYDGKRLSIGAFTLTASQATAALTGWLDTGKFAGTAQLRLADLERYTQIAKTPLKGQIEVDAKFSGDTESQALEALISGESTGVAVGNDTADRLLAPATTYRAHVVRSANGNVRAEDTSVSNALLQATFAGERSKSATNLSGDIALASLAAVDPKLTGTAKLAISLRGPDTDLSSKLMLTGDGMTLNGKPVEKPIVSFEGRGPVSRHAGQFAMTGAISGELVKGAASVTVSDQGAGTVNDLLLEIAGAKLTGDVEFSPATVPTGRVNLDAQDLGRVGRAIGMNLKGRVAADVALGADGDKGSATLKLTASGVGIDDLSIKRVRATGNVANYTAAPVGTLDAEISQIVRAGKPLGEAVLNARFEGDAATFKSKGRIDGGSFSLIGSARSHEGTNEIEITTASYSGNDSAPQVKLAAPARISVLDGVVSTRAFQVAIGTGILRINGSAGADVLDIQAELKQVPAAVVALAAPDLGLAGTINGNATIKGKASDPKVNTKITVAGVSIKETRSQQLPAADITADIKAADGTAQVNVRTTARGGLDMVLKGTAGFKKDGRLALSGQGKVPLGYGNVFLADRDARVDGVAMLSAQITGPIAEPQIDGTIQVNGATARDSEVGLELKNIVADIGFARDKVTLRNLSAISAKGGNIKAGGAVLLPSGDDPSMNIDVKLAAFKFGNQDPVAGEIDGQMTVTGPVSALVARGDLQIKRMDITIPNQMPKSVEALDIRHVNAPARFASKERQVTGAEDPDASGPGVTLALDVRAHDRIFVRGRGLDAQLGGAIKIRGSAKAPFTDGQFSMSRGRLTIIGRQLDFSRGNIIFTGALEPTLDMEAKGDADGTTVIVTVTGPASKPKFQFSSSPELPEDEVVSLLLFNKKLAQLSPTQLVQLAGEIDKIGGLSSGPGTLDKMKSALGIDVLDVTTDEKGNAQATAGSYIDEKTYVGVKQGMSLGQSRVVIDHKLTKHLKARGEVGSDGKSKLGVGFEWEY